MKREIVDIQYGKEERKRKNREIVKLRKEYRKVDIQYGGNNTKE